MAQIVVIDDDIDILYNLTELLQLSGYDVIGAEDAETGLTYIAQHQPALVFCDILMPESDGWDVLEAVRTDPALADIPFVFLTALADKQSKYRIHKSAADGYISKPFALPDIMGYVQNYVKN